MKKADVQVGRHYKVKVSGNEVPVLITGELPGGGWEAKNIKTGKPIRIKSAQRLRAALRQLDEPGQTTTADKRVMTKAEYEAQVDTPSGDVGPGAAKPAGSADKPKDKRKRAKGEPGATGAKRPSGLDAAVAVLAEAGEPLNAKDMVDRMLSTGLWKTGGKTPANTLYAAIIREISIKGDQARFRKVERGKFTLAK